MSSEPAYRQAERTRVHRINSGVNAATDDDSSTTDGLNEIEI
ncbi:MAG: hypothetical protein WAT14_14300 [Chitinophagaceae bacterium]